MMPYRYVTADELGDCPAAVDCTNGIIEVNRDVWAAYDEFERRFILAHEEAHYYLDTDDETEADIYALRKVAGTAPKSLSRAVKALLKVGVLDEGRYYYLYEEALKLDEEMGNKAAAKELKNFRNKFKGGKNMNRRVSLDGDEPETIDEEIIDEIEVTEEPEQPEEEAAIENRTRSRKAARRLQQKRGIAIMGCWFSWSDICLICIAVLLYMRLGK